MKIKSGLLLLLAILVIFGLNAQPGLAQEAVVHAVLFFSPTCPHCHEVMEKSLPPIAQKYGAQLDIVGIDVSQEAGVTLYQAAVEKYKIADDRLGVPMLIVGDTVLVGSAEIPDQLPGLVDQGLAAGGVGFPDIPGLKEVLASQPQSPSSQASSPQNPPAAQNPASGGPSFMTKFNQNPVGNAGAVVILVGMLVALIIAGVSFASSGESRLLRWPEWTIPALSVIGLGIAAYLAYVEISKTNTICGPGFGCDAVQTSSYAFLFGVLPVGVLGVLGYLGILGAWILKQFGPLGSKKFFTLSIWGMAWFGVLFSVYLTFLEPFVIGASCMWCLGSAVIMTLVLLGSTEPAKQALKIDEEAYDELDEEDQEEEDEQSQKTRTV